MSPNDRFGNNTVLGKTKVLYGADLNEAVGEFRRSGKRIGFTNGCFDILHVGHLAIIEFARATCDVLVVGVNSDASVKRLKGPTRPINSEADRALIIAALQAVAIVVIFGEDTPLELIGQIRPDCLIKGADYTIDQIIGAQSVLAWGGKVVTCPIVPGKSTSATIESIAAVSGLGNC